RAMDRLHSKERTIDRKRRRVELLLNAGALHDRHHHPRPWRTPSLSWSQGLLTILGPWPGSAGMSHPDPSIPVEEGPPSSTATSPSLLERVKADDAAAWDRLVGLVAPLVYHWCRRYDLPEQEIADVFQDVFHAVATHIADFRRKVSGDTFRGWLRTITRNKVRDHFRKVGREPGGAGGTEAQL